MTSSAEPRDNIATIVATGLLAYASADIAHHVLGHGGACLALGGRIISLSSIYVNCTVRGATVDLAGPFANLAVGLIALAAAYRTTIPATKLFFTLTTGFNLMWFSLQLLASAVSRSDDWAWAMHVFHVSQAERIGMIAFGAIAYLASMRAVAAAMASFAQSPARARTIVWTAWLTGGALACVTALFDPQPFSAILHHAAPQSFILSLGLLFVPRWAARISAVPAPPIKLSIPLILAALAVMAGSIVYLGPGFAI